MIDWAGLIGLFGPLSIMVALLVVALLSKRLGKVTRAPRFYWGLYLAALLMGISLLARLLNIGRGQDAATDLSQDPIWVLLYVGFPAVAVTIGVLVAWRYWSWLLAERG